MAAWVLAAALGIVGVLRWHRPRERLFGAGLVLVCIAAGLRELDAHLWIGPRLIGDWGMHFRIDWWLSASAPVLPRLLWLGGGIAAATVLVWAGLKVWPRVLLLVWSRDRAWMLFVLAVVLLFCGYAMDDLVGRGQFVPKVYTKAVEESAELLGAILFASAVGLHAWVSLSVRERRAEARLAA